MELSPPPTKKAVRTIVSRPISVGRCHVQTAKDRFGQDGVNAIKDRDRLASGQPPQGMHQPFTWPGAVDDDANAEPSIFRSVPSMQFYRHNLTALSHSSNLYFAAYQGRIFVYALHGGPRNSVPAQPNLQLKPRPTPEARAVGGVIDASRPHCINHMITGFLGSEEIVLACYDDGDVVAYYVKPLARRIFSASSGSCGRSDRSPSTRKQHEEGHWKDSSTPTPFLHENVQKTAWGLAIHQQSRLIAVSTNLREITVFAPAIQRSSRSTHTCTQAHEPLSNPESRVRARARNWRIIIRLGLKADNIPNVCFLEDKDGFAEKICAVDIKGQVWVADIWKAGQPVSRFEVLDNHHIQSDEYYPDSSRGWGIMAFREESFMKVYSVEDLVGIPAQQCQFREPGKVAKQPIVRIDARLQEIPDNPCPPPTERLIRPGPNVMATWMGNMTGGFQAWADLLNPPPGLAGVASVAPIFTNPPPVLAPNFAPPPALATLLMNPPPAFGPAIAQMQNFGVMMSDSDDEESMDEELELEVEIDGWQEAEEEDDDYVEEEESESDEASGMATEGTDGLQAVPIDDDETSPTSASPTTTPGALEAQFQQLVTGNTLGIDNAVTEILQTLQNEIVLMFQNVFGDLVQGSSHGQTHGSFHDLAADNRPNTATLIEQHERVDMKYYPDKGLVDLVPWSKKLRVSQARMATTESNRNAAKEEDHSASDETTPGYYILRSFEKDFEMWRLSESTEDDKATELNISCSNALTFNFSMRRTNRFFRATSRISMIVHIPELFLVVLGSPTGRVLLATLTKLASPQIDATGQWSWEHGMRVECVLPWKSDETQHREATFKQRPLYGLAVAPILEDRSDDTLPARFRLMLHYHSHDIISYEISRDPHSGRVWIL